MEPTAALEQDRISDAEATGTRDSAQPQIVEELLIEEISIDGMCGVY
ncbi:MAG: mycofactocin precursor [Actinobacteria bacterium]|jgi:mycofactocin precursor|nr:mycofactocin precursor [Actinomycetota bacterium]NBT25972.1 mycofactocin precursor [Actinomycetota bacterium]NBY12211.1 mycofactocin precursor [Actinomycetota bacterium]NCZ89397.1 mycofactocin precursor [Actinomycetota bacterium]NCZ91777.1 mycofactocin precursor [Actinomycetota bacterium]